jgi:Uma2 family endonuclease
VRMPSTADPEVPEVDYPHLTGEEHNPLMESTLPAAWCTLLIQSVRHTLAGTGAMVTGNTPFLPGDGGPHTAPDLMVVPGLAGQNFGRYEVGVHGPAPSVCIEVVSPSNTVAALDRRLGRWLAAGVAEVYELDPERETVVRVTTGPVGSRVRTRSAVTARG